MKKNVFLIGLLFGALSINAQQIQKIFTISGIPGTAINFKSISDLEGNEFINNESLIYSQTNESQKNPNLIASLAYDKSNNSLVYMPMNESKVFFHDLSTKKTNSIDASSDVMISNCNEGSYFTRMTLGQNGIIYALSNNGSDFIQINAKTKKVQNLGSISFTSQEVLNTYGGDLIADNNGNLILISANGSVYKINIATKSNNFLGKIKGIPAEYTVNGAAVLENGQILIGNSKGLDLYTFSLGNLNASFYKKSKESVYDLASEFLVDSKTNKSLAKIKSVDLYPTNVKNRKLYFKHSLDLTQFTVKIYDLFSQEVFVKSISSVKNNENELNVQNLLPGVYVVKVVDANNNEVASEKIVIVK